MLAFITSYAFSAPLAAVSVGVLIIMTMEIGRRSMDRLPVWWILSFFFASFLLTYFFSSMLAGKSWTGFDAVVVSCAIFAAIFTGIVWATLASILRHYVEKLEAKQTP